MIGLMGTILGEHNINIADMTVGRSRLSELAVTLINVDSPVPRHVLQMIASQKKIDFVKQVFLPGQEGEIEDFANDDTEARG
jgi:D-3-phosphoglycerate dehydrogenase